MSDTSKLWLRSLTIHRYEQFRDCPRIELSPDDNLILGINGSGKTSLLRLLAAVMRWDYDALLGQPFDVEFEQVLEVDPARIVSIHGRVQYQPTLLGGEQVSSVRRSRNAAFNPHFDPRLGGEQQRPVQRPTRSKYEGFAAKLDVRRQEGGAFEIYVRDSQLYVQIEDRPENNWFLERWRAEGFLLPDLRTQGTVVESWLADALSSEISGIGIGDLDERARETFMIHETDVDFARLTEEVPYEYEMEGKYDEPGSSASLRLASGGHGQWLSLLGDLFDEAARQQTLQTYVPPVTYGRDGDPERTYDLRSVLTAIGADSISFRLKIEQTRSIGDRILIEGRGVEIRVRFPSGTEVIDSRLTFGQKRLITIALGALLCGGSPLLVDEIDNGLHPGLVEKVLGLIRGRQTFIASHNKLVVDLLDYESPEDICRTIHICRRNQDGTQSLVPLSDDQVREVFEKIEVGIMNPSDVLLQEGLW